MAAEGDIEVVRSRPMHLEIDRRRIMREPQCFYGRLIARLEIDGGEAGPGGGRRVHLFAASDGNPAPIRRTEFGGPGGGCPGFPAARDKHADKKGNQGDCRGEPRCENFHGGKFMARLMIRSSSSIGFVAGSTPANSLRGYVRL